MPKKKPKALDAWSALAGKIKKQKKDRDIHKVKSVPRVVVKNSLHAAEYGEPKEKTAERLKPEKKRKEKKAKSVKMDPRFPDAFQRWKDSTPLTTLKKELGVTRRILKKAFIVLAGSREAFAKLRADGAGGQKLFGGKRATGGRKAIEIAMDDSKVRHVSITERRKKKWGSRHVYADHGAVMISIAPDGTEYVKAKPTEKADLIFNWPTPKEDPKWDYTAMQPIRLRKFEDSSFARKLKKRERAETQEDKAQRERKKIKKAKREERRKLRGMKRSRRSRRT